jgi:hypothetical protein
MERGDISIRVVLVALAISRYTPTPTTNKSPTATTTATTTSARAAPMVIGTPPILDASNNALELGNGTTTPQELPCLEHIVEPLRNLLSKRVGENAYTSTSVLEWLDADIDIRDLYPGLLPLHRVLECIRALAMYEQLRPKLWRFLPLLIRIVEENNRDPRALLGAIDVLLLLTSDRDDQLRTLAGRIHARDSQIRVILHSMGRGEHRVLDGYLGKESWDTMDLSGIDCERYITLAAIEAASTPSSSTAAAVEV